VVANVGDVQGHVGSELTLDLNGEPKPQSPVRRWPIIVAALLALFLAAVAVLSARLSPCIRSWTIKTLRDRYESDVAFKKLDVLSVFPKVQLRGEGLELHYKGRKDVPPLISMKKLSVEGSVLGFLCSP